MVTDEGPRLQWKINESGEGVKWTRRKNIKERWNTKGRKSVKKNAESYNEKAMMSNKERTNKRNRIKKK